MPLIKDCDYTLQKGVRLWLHQQETPVPVIEDIGHVLVGTLKVQFENTSGYKRFTALMSQGAKCLRQTECAFLMPLKLHRKGNFSLITGNYELNVINYIQ